MDFLPTHFSLRIRDAIEEQEIKTVTNIYDLSSKKEQIIKEPFKFKLNLDHISNLKISDSDIVECKEFLEKDSQRENNYK